MPEKVEVRPAFAFDCPDCGREGFARAVVVELSPEEIEELRQEHGIQVWETGHLLMRPTQVICDFCQAAFRTVDYGA